MTGPLAGFRVIDLCSMMSGPWAADILGDQGADVIKVEVPNHGDHVRDLPNRHHDFSAMFVHINRSKRSLTINLKDPEGVEILKKLVSTADVLLQNFRPGVVERLGISYEDLSPINPQLVYLSMSGLGERGPLAGHRVYDSLIQGLSGLTTVQAGSDSERPRLIRTVLPDKLSAIVGSQAITAGLLARARTGEGQHIKLSMLDGILSFLFASDMGAYTFLEKPVPIEQGGSFIDLIYETEDGYITVATNSNKEWQALCNALDRAEWQDDERFATPAGRLANINERLKKVQEVLAENTSGYWLDRLEHYDVPAAPMLKRSEVLEHPQVIASEIVVTNEHPIIGPLRQARVPARFLGTPTEPPRGAPMLGEHNDEILADLGFDAAAIADLIERKVAGDESVRRTSIQV